MRRRIFVYEYCSAQDARCIPSSLRTEGRAMLTAILRDFNRMPGVETVTLLHSSFTGRALPGRRRRTDNDEASAFGELAEASDWTLVIAPETGGLLLSRCRWVIESRGRLLGPSPEAVRLTADKLVLSEHLRASGIPTPDCHVVSGSESQLPAPFPAVWKPRDGAGSQATFLLRGPEDWSAAAVCARAEGWRGERVLQPFVPGQAVSVSLLLGGPAPISLPPTLQLLSNDSRFRYEGGTLPLPVPLGERAARLAARAVGEIPGLMGSVGVDLVLGDAADGGGDQVIEINPRLTTSYIGLQALTRGNLAGAMLRAAQGQKVLPLRWKTGSVRFFPDGRIIAGIPSIGSCAASLPFIGEAR